MACLKCGKETGESTQFCDSCLAQMKAYPVKPGTAVQLPHRVEAAAERKKARRPLNTNEELHRLQTQVRWLSALAFAMGVLLLLLAALLLLT